MKINSIVNPSIKILNWLVLLIFLILPHSAFAQKTVKIGVLVNLGKETAVRMWTPTADYLTARIPQHSFTIIPLNFDEINRSVEFKEVDFVITNPGIYVELEYAHGVTRIATLDTLWKGKEYNSFGGVIFTRAGRGDINELRDLKGKTFMAVHETSYGGWRAALRELKAGYIDPWRHFSRLLFSGESQEQTVFAVRDGKADAGTIRTGILERMAEEGRISLEDFKILNPQKVEGFPLLLSTRLYPEWAFARLRHTSDALAKKVAAALLDMPADSPAAKAGEIAGLTVPLDYQPVHQLMQELHLGPYKDYGKLTLGQGLKRYWPVILMLFAITFFLGYATLYLLKLKKEIAERKKAEEALKENEQKFRQIAENIREVFWVTDPEKNQMIYISPAYEAIWGRTCESLYAEPKNWLEAIHSDDRERVLGAAVTKQTTGEYDEQYRIVTPEGAIRWIRDRAFPVKDESGKVYRITGVAEDITEQKKDEEVLQESERKYRELVENANSIILRWNRKGEITFMNEFGQKYYGYSEAEIIGCHVVGTIVPETESTGRDLRPLMDQICANPKDFDQNINENMRRNGERVWIDWTNKVVLDEQRQIKEILSIGSDITERRKAEERLSRLTRLYSVLSKINEAIVRTDEPEELYRQACEIIVEDGLFKMAWIGIVDPDTLLVKPAAIHGHEDGYLKKKRISIDESIPEGRGPTGIAIRNKGFFICNDIENDPIMAPWRDEAIKREYRSSVAFALKSGTKVIGTLNIYSGMAYFFQEEEEEEEEEEVRLLKALAEDISYAIESMKIEGLRIHAEHELQKLTIELESRVKDRTAELKDSQTALISIVEDLNQKTEELRVANERLKEVDRLKSMFIASMSHELRTPLNSIIGFSSIIINEWLGPLNQEQKENLVAVLRSGKHLLSLINDVIDVSKIEAGMIEVHIDDIDLFDVVEEAAKSFEKEANDREIVLKIEAVHLMLHTDRRRLLQCVMNLISNAVKFTEKGSVQITARKIEGNHPQSPLSLRGGRRGVS